MNITIDVQKALDELTKGLESHQQEIIKATNRADRKFINWAEKEIVKEVSRVSGIKQQVLKKLKRVSIRKKRKSNGQLTNIWIGLNPIYADELGNPVATGSGVIIGRFGYFHQAFIIKKRLVYYRTSKDRYPISRALYAFDQPVTSAIESMELSGQQRFLTLLDQEINYAIHYE